MKGRCYLLSLEEFWESADGGRYFKEALHKVDETRREKAERMRTKKTGAACLGAGLLLQFAVQVAMREAGGEDACISADAAGDMQFQENVQSQEDMQFQENVQSQRDMQFQENMLSKGDILSQKDIPPQRDGRSQKREAEGYELVVYSVSQVLKQLNGPLNLRMDYGRNGKPYLKDYPLCFNLSHSGNYVVCAVSAREVGVDIQEYKKADVERLARRFFSEEEQSILMACTNEKEQCKLFYRLWTRKEAYGKLTGEGIAALIDKNMLRVKNGGASATGNGDDTPLFWQEWELDGYAITLCQYGMK